MKKDLLLLFAAILVVAVLIMGTDIQSVDEYYLTHIDEITPDTPTVTFSIRCDAVLANEEQLDPALREADLLPADGVILAEQTYALREGDTVFDILYRAVRHEQIAFSYQGADKNAFGSVYVQGIGHLYEFSCGAASGWVYRVNGEFPDKGCSRYLLQDGDCVEWVYSCNLSDLTADGQNNARGEAA